MSHLDVQIPDSLKKAMEEAARREGIPLDQLVALAMAEKLSALRTVEFLRDERKSGAARRFRAISLGGSRARAG
jgi:hypothetical protein